MLLLLATLAAADVHSESGGVFTDGAFYTGCNYWASHAGVYMWRDWNGEQVEKDMANDAAIFEVECKEGGRWRAVVPAGHQGLLLERLP